MCFKKKTEQGTKIDRRKIPGLPSEAVHSRALAIIVGEFSKTLDLIQVQNVVQNATIEWWAHVAPRPSTGELNTVVVDHGQIYSGLVVGSTCKVAWRGKLWRSAFAHEFGHVVGYKLLAGADADHNNNQIWDVVKVINSRLKDADI